jgi:type II secretory pathway component PulJ
MSNKRHSNLAAFTLIELLAALAVLSMLVIMLFMAFSNASRMMILGSNQIEKNQVVRAVLQQISRDLERTVYSGSVVNMYQASTTTDYIFTGSGISNSTLYCLSTLYRDEGNAYGGIADGSAAEVGYRVIATSVTTYGAPVTKYVLQRGADNGTNLWDTPTNWYENLNNPTTFWQTLSDNVVGLAFQFYTAADTGQSTWDSTALPNRLPTSVGITIWAIDSASYDLALKLGLAGTGQTIFKNNVHKYTSRVFLPQSTQNP